MGATGIAPIESRGRKWKTRQSVQGPPPGPTSLRFRQVMRWVAHDQDYLFGLLEQYGSVFSVNILPGRRVTVLADPEAVRTVATAPPDQMRGGINHMMRPLLGDHSLFSLHGEEHLRLRRMSTSAFHGINLERHARVTRQVAASHVEGWDVDGVSYTRPLLITALGEAIGRMVWGDDRYEQIVPLMGRLEQAVKLGTDRVSSIAMMLLNPQAPAIHRMIDRHLGPIYQEILDLADQFNEEPEELAERLDFFSAFLRARDADGQPMSDQELCDQVVTMVAAGHETSANALSWLFDLLAHHPEIQERLARSADNEDDGEYYRWVIYEALRIRPVIPFTLTSTVGDFELGGWLLADDTPIFTSPLLTHRNPLVWERPHEFLPDRWEDRKPAGYDWIPFGAGVHRCIGSQLAVLQMEAVLRETLMRYRIEPVGKPERATMRCIVLAPAKDGPVRFVAR